MAPNPPINWGFLAPNSGKTELLACPKELRRWEAPQQGISSPSLPDFFGREAGRTGGATQGAELPPPSPGFSLYLPSTHAWSGASLNPNSESQRARENF